MPLGKILHTHDLLKHAVKCIIWHKAQNKLQENVGTSV